MSNITRAELVTQLRKLGIETVTADYDGSGDSGQIEEPEFGSRKVPGELATAVQDLFYNLLEEHYGGWEISGGSFGQFVLDVTTDSIKLEHNICVEEVETEEQVL
jgi:hypothetical protein